MNLNQAPQWQATRDRDSGRAEIGPGGGAQRSAPSPRMISQIHRCTFTPICVEGLGTRVAGIGIREQGLGLSV